MMNRSRLVSVLLVAMLGLVTFQPASAQDGADLRSYYSGNGFVQRGLYELAIGEYQKFIAAHGEHEKAPMARYGLGLCRFRLKEYAAAREMLGTIPLDGFGFAAETRMLLGQSALALGDAAAAANAFGQIRANHRDHDLIDDASGLLVEADYRRRAYQEAIAVADEIAANWHDSPFRERAELFAGLSEMAIGRNPAAAERLSQLVSLYPDGEFVDQATLLLAQSSHRARSVNNAIEAYQSVIARGTERLLPDALYGLGLVLYEEGDAAEAAPLLDKVIETFPNSNTAEAARVLRGRVAFDAGQFDDAGKLFQAVDDGEGALRDEAAYWLAKCELRTGRPDAAVERLTGAIETFEDSDLLPQMRYDLGVAHLRADEVEEGLAAMNAFLAAHNDHALAPDAISLVAFTLHEDKRYEESTAACETFRQRFPDHRERAGIEFLAAENAYLERDFAAARVAYRSFLENHGDDPRRNDATFRLGMSHYHLGGYDVCEPMLAAVVSGADTPQRFRPAILALGDAAFQQGQWEAAERLMTLYLTFSDAPSRRRCPSQAGCRPAATGKMGRCPRKLPDAPAYI